MLHDASHRIRPASGVRARCWDMSNMLSDHAKSAWKLMQNATSGVCPGLLGRMWKEEMQCVMTEKCSDVCLQHLFD